MVSILLVSMLLAAIHDNNHVAMELLLTSKMFCNVFNDDERHVVLEDGMCRIGGHGAEQTISLLIAHGADINGDDDLPIYGSRELASVPLLRHIASEGACFIGLQSVLHRMLVDPTTLRELVRLGIDVREDAVVDLRGTASSGSTHRLEMIHVLLAEEIVDVDAQTTEGRYSDSGIPLIRTVRGLFSLRDDGIDDTLDFIELLIRFGADA